MPDTQSLILFGAAMVAGVVCFRLFMILGRRTGHEPTTRAPGGERSRDVSDSPRAAPAALDGPRPDMPSSSGLLDIQLADHKFDTPHFLTGARDAYGRIVKAFAAGDRAQLAPLLSSQVLDAFEGAIAARGASAPVDVPVFKTLHDARIVAASLEGRHAEITVAFRAEFTAPPEAAAPEGVAGQPTIQDVNDVWTFARDLDSADPNWRLVATTGELPASDHLASDHPQ